MTSSNVWADSVAGMWMVNADNTLAENPLTPRQRLQDNIKKKEDFGV